MMRKEAKTSPVRTHLEVCVSQRRPPCSAHSKGGQTPRWLQPEETRGEEREACMLPQSNATYEEHTTWLLGPQGLLSRNPALDTMVSLNPNSSLHSMKPKKSQVVAVSEYQWLHVSLKNIYIPQPRLQFLNAQHGHQTKSLIQYIQWFSVTTLKGAHPDFVQHCRAVPFYWGRVMQSCVTTTSILQP